MIGAPISEESLTHSVPSVGAGAAIAVREIGAGRWAGGGVPADGRARPHAV
jgi:hypothetical protein